MLEPFYYFNYFNNLRILQFVCISWKMKCLTLLMHGATMKLQGNIVDKNFAASCRELNHANMAFFFLFAVDTAYLK